jgi:hypothetical protein
MQNFVRLLDLLSHRRALFPHHRVHREPLDVLGHAD